MTRYTLTVLDTTQIQRYVFGSNRLQENIGASELVELATHQWAYEALPVPHNVAYHPKSGWTDQTIDTLAAEVVYAGGGNTVILFQTSGSAREFARRLTRRVLLEAPGLDLVVAHREFDWEDDSLAVAVQETLGRDLARKKQNRQPSLPLLGLGVTAPCRSTGLVAAAVTDQGERVSREIQAKLSEGVRRSAEKRLSALLPRIETGGWEIPRNHDEMGRQKGEESYLAVVHADGNKMGQRVEAISQSFQEPKQNRAYIHAMRDFSAQVQEAAQQALQSTTDLLADALCQDRDLPADYPKFPFRPIVFGGDDVTFVCNGRYGLPLAVQYLRAFETATAKQPAFAGRAAHACAGVAVVKVHYPFARAYRLGESLCHSAKSFAKEDDNDRSALDWHFAMSGVTGSLRDMRRREYAVGPGAAMSLCMRPVLLDETGATWRSWPVFEALAAEFAAEAGDWYDRRNKVKSLREALRQGPEAVKEFLRTYRLDGLPQPRLFAEPVVGETGWDDLTGLSPYFDPVEAMDFYLRLQ